MQRVLAGALFLLPSALICLAQTRPPQLNSGSDESALAKQIADPTAPLIIFNLREVHAGSIYGVPGSGNAFVFQPVIPFRAWGRGNLFRATVNYAVSGPRGAGYESVSVFNLVAFNAKWGRWGVGPVVQFLPNRGPGRDTTLAGPAAGLVGTKGKWILGLLNQNLLGQYTRVSNLQPVIAYLLGGGWTLASGEAQWIIDWTQPQFTNTPIGVQLAKVMRVGGQPVRFSVQPEYNASGVSGTPRWTIRFTMAILAFRK